MSKELTVFATANVGGIALYVYFYWRIVENIRYEQRTAEFADGLAFLITGILLLCIFVIVDLIWVAAMANQHRKHNDSMAAALTGIFAIGTWIATFFAVPHLF